MRTSKSSSLLTIFCIFSFLSFSALAQNITITKPVPDKKDDKPAADGPAAKPTPAPTPSFMDQPDYKAYMAGMLEKDPAKKMALLEKYLSDFPNSAFISSGNQALLDAMVRATPNDKDRIYQQALKTISTVRTDLPIGSYQAGNTYNSVVSALYKADMNDKAEEIAQKGIAIIDDMIAKETFQSKSSIWVTLGQISFKKGDLKTAEQYFKQATTGDYDGNQALLGLADIAEKRNKGKLQLDYLMQADAKGSLKKDRRDKIEELYIKQHGSTSGLSETLDANYKRLNPLPMTLAKYNPTDKRSKRTVLAELFTGSACHPCITADVAFEALMERYQPSDVAVLIYDLHIPGPDPITNPATVARAKYYKTSSTPTYIINGSDKDVGGGTDRKQAKRLFDKVTPKIDAQLEKENEADLTISASLNKGVVNTSVNVDNVKGDYSGLKLYIGLVENELSYMGENGIRFHPMAVRELGGENRDGFALKDKSGKFEWQFDLQKVSGDLKTYIDKYEQDRQKDDKDFAFTEKKYEIDSKNLSVVAFIQDEKTKNILQTSFINLAETKK